MFDPNLVVWLRSSLDSKNNLTVSHLRTRQAYEAMLVDGVSPRLAESRCRVYLGLTNSQAVYEPMYPVTDHLHHLNDSSLREHLGL